LKTITCFHCKTAKPEFEFFNDRSRPNGKKPRCKPCDKLSLDRDRRREYEKEYRKANPERRSAIVKRSMDANKEHHNAKRREYLDSPRGRDRHRAHGQARRARERTAFVEHVSHSELYVEQVGRCHICGTRRYLSQMELDHVIPIARGGLHQKDNCKMACVSCNRSKGAKLPEELSY
jgi:5-methylcytosine-specific restriction endonuclease McrA